MNEPFLDFEWTVASEYVWTDWRDDDGQPVVVAAVDLESRLAIFAATGRHGETGPVLGAATDPPQVKRYRPMDRKHATLFRIFASVDPADRDAILAFANEYGLLGVKLQHQVWSKSKRRSKHQALGESHLDWAEEIARMQETIQQWTGRQTGGDPWPDLSRVVNAHLSQIQFQVRQDAAGELGFSLAPRTLLSAMWLQLARDLVGHREVALCNFCSRPMEISTAATGYRTNRAFCSDSCKTSDYRRRKRTALRLAQEGQSVRRIAKVVKTKAATVRRWLEKAQGKGSN